MYTGRLLAVASHAGSCGWDRVRVVAEWSNVTATSRCTD